MKDYRDRRLEVSLLERKALVDQTKPEGSTLDIALKKDRNL